MTTVVAAFCPWTRSEETTGIAMVADCRLTVEVAPGVFQVYSDEAQKLFRVGRFVMAGYSGYRRSARFALARLAAAIPRTSRPPASAALEDHIRKSLRKGAIEAEKKARSTGEKAQCGPFSVFEDFLDDADRFGLLVHKETQGEKALPHSAISGDDGAQRVLVMGSGMVAVGEYRRSLARVSTEIAPGVAVDDMPFERQAGIVGLALLDVLELKQAPLSGGGLQAMSLSERGVQAWEIRSSSAEYIHDPSADPDWRRHGPARFTQ